ncbi:zinc-binding dehydrogenase [Nocardia sp. R6R-6]|uniref:zinc-binding dehydrogenase n=1 Tax=Nocardia sp. R6R-6 TaxID=3459303 RepID=UPI00403DEB62
MQSVYLSEPDSGNPISALRYGDCPLADPPDGWTTVRVQAAAANRHDLFALSGVGPAIGHLPIILGSDAAGVDEDGRAVLVYPVVEDENGTSLLSERHQGTFAEYVNVPRDNLIPIPSGISTAEAACLPTAWLTAYSMLFTRAGVGASDTVLVQGAGGGLSTALIMLAAAAGARVWVTGTSADKKAFATVLGADAVFDPGARLPEQVGYVMDSVGAATWNHSINCLQPGGTMVVSGATSGFEAMVDILWVFAKQISILGSSLGSRVELTDLIGFCLRHGICPPIHESFPLSEAGVAFQTMQNGTATGKLLLVPGR